MFNMKTATVRDVQHRLKDILMWITAGQSVEVTRRGRVVARITPPAPLAPLEQVKWPDFGARLKKNFPRGIPGKPVSQIIVDDREERA